MLRRKLAAFTAALLTAGGLAATAAPAPAAPAPAPVVDVNADMPGPVTSGVDAIPNGGKRVKAWEDAARAKGHFSRNPADHPAKNFSRKPFPVPPRPPVAGAGQPTAAHARAMRGPGDFFLYNSLFKYDSAPEGIMADFTIANPYINTPADAHTLMEHAVQGGPSNLNIVEIGWHIDPVVGCSRQGSASTDDPCLFVYHWEGGNETCYNTCQFVDNPTANYAPGDRIPNVNNSSGDKFKIRETSDAWWVSFGPTSDPDSYVGYFLKSNWSGATGFDGADNGGFDQMALWQLFIEVAAGEATPCTDFGNGLEAKDTNADGVEDGGTAARIVNVQAINDPGSVVTDTAPGINSGNNVAGARGNYKMNNTAPINDFRLGGPGWKGNNTLPGATNGCG